MEITFRTQTPVSQRLDFRPLFARSSIRFSQSSSLNIQYRANGIFHPFCATGDFSRKRQKKWSRRRSRGCSSIGFVPKVPAEGGSEKREQWNSEDNRTPAIPPVVDSMAPDSKYGGFDVDILEVSQGKKGEGAINWKAGNLPQVNNLKAVDENVTESENFGSETQGFLTITNDKKGDGLDNVRKNRTLESHQKIEVDNYVNGCKVLVSETSSADRISSEKAVNISENECNKLERIVTETELLGSETVDSDTMVSDEKEAENRALVNYESTESYKNIIKTVLSGSEAMRCDATTGGENDIMNLVSIQENLALVSYPSAKSGNRVDETKRLESGEMGSNTVACLKKEVRDVVNIKENQDLVSYQSIESNESVPETKLLGSETTDSNTVTIDEIKTKDFVIQEGIQALVRSESTESGKDITRTELLSSETMGSVAVTGDGKEVKDLVIFQENLTLVGSGKGESTEVSLGSETRGSDSVTIGLKEVLLKSFDTIESIKNVTDSELLSSETMGPDIFTSDDKEAKDLNVTDSELLSPKTMGPDTFTSNDKEAKDSNVTDSELLSSETMGPDTFTSDDKEAKDSNVTDSELLSSETMGPDTFTSDDKEAKDSTSIQENMAVVDENINETDLVGSETQDTRNIDVKELEESLQKMEIEMEASMSKQVLADENFSKGNKMFIYPGIAKPDHKIEVFYNRSLSSLKNEPDVKIMGAFNEWRWKSFTLRLEKTHLIGDWWTCQIHVPKEAYKIDFVFFNGRGIYDNNNKKDFHITVEGGMSILAFEEFLVEDKNRELEKLLKEQSERERQSEEQRQRDEERAAMAADLAQAKLEVKRKREQLRLLMNKPIPLAENVCFFEPREFKGGDVVRLYYNKISGPLTQVRDIWIHGGHNNWKDGLSIVSRLVKSEETNAHWWYVEVTVPEQAFILDWVFTDGPPQNASIFDNNNCQDFHAVVPVYIRDKLYWVEEEDRICQRLQEERRAREEAIRAKAEKTAHMKLELKEQTQNTFLVSQRHIVYTDPIDVQAGHDVTVYYNPSNTVLNGKAEVWFRCSFNHWTHHRGSLAPQKMLPTGNGYHVKTTIKVPLDAYTMDFVFSERKDGGTFDNKNNMDYHVPVFGGIAKEPPMHIVHIAVEMAPIAKVGGLGDIVTSLSRAVQDLNHHVEIVFPKYDCLNQNNVKDLHYLRSYPWEGIDIKVWFGKVEGLSVYFLEPQNGFFRSGNIYVGLNDGARFGFFCRAALEFLLQMGFHPDIIHCHDWTSAPVAWMHKEHYANSLSNARVIFTIHNLEFGAILIGKAMAYADKATTVSSTYSKEVAEHPAISPHLYKFHGILNGIDPEIWDPYNDNLIPISYTSDNVVEGKKAAKELLQQRASLKKADLPLVGIISRLTHQKGIHLIKHAIWHTLERGGQVVLLGTASDLRVQSDFLDLSNQMHNLHCDRARLFLTYDEPLSHLIYAGADFILVPSIFEPCGLTQLVAMRYGSIPVVRKTGGLYDTVFDVDNEQERAKSLGLEPNGFNFEGADPAGLNYALDRAISSWYDGKEWLNALRKRVMEQDWSWNRPALEYIELYHAARKKLSRGA